ncbi:MAG: beta-ketoacyl synthase chain length factor, partial [Kiritimatiellales bacterium]|nr:beta-ketoacyl synthase chain length factor [Kiritimatiellales bacterium]
QTTFAFLDDILDYGDAGVSPTVFSHSVHNAAVSYISRLLEIKGPTWTVTQFRNPFEEAVQLAQAWLNEDRCDYVLLGAADECGPVMEYICREKLPIATDGRIGPDAYVPGEGAAFFLVGNEGGGEEFKLPEKSFAPLFGNLLTGRALDCAASAILGNG